MNDTTNLEIWEDKGFETNESDKTLTLSQLQIELGIPVGMKFIGTFEWQ